MKILAIRGQNLASLEKEFEIDFTREPLKSAGIFAITGSTGAGKSTLLDALCLALFDETPRTNHARESIAIPDVKDKLINQKDCRTILRRGTGEGYAEVDFVSLGGERFRSRWMVKRARAKADGSMQNSEIRLTNLSADTEEQGRKTELLARIVELIGLSFEQFTRSVLLAQGDFATFLKARQVEKAELLEKLTGTEIYSSISVRIYERSKIAEQEYNRLVSRINDIELLPDERLEQLNVEKCLIGREIEELKQQITIGTEKIKWMAEQEILQKNIQETNEQLSRLVNKMEEAWARYDYIIRVEKVQEIRDAYLEWRSTGKQLADQQQNLKRLGLEYKESTELLKATQVLVQKSERELQLFNDNCEQIEPQIVRARELDVRINGLQENLKEIRLDYEQSNQSKVRIERSILQHQQETTTVTQSLHFFTEWFEEYQNYASLIPRSELILNLMEDLQATEKQLAENRQILDRCKSLSVQEQVELLRLKSEVNRLQQLLPAEIIEWRACLQEGVPCPVCGNIHHPWAKVAREQGLKEVELENVKKAVMEQLTALTEKAEQRQSEMTRLVTLIDNYEAHQIQLWEKLETYLAEIVDWKELWKQQVLQQQLKEIAVRWKEYTSKQNLLTEQLGQLQLTLKLEQNNSQELHEKVCLKEAKCVVLATELTKLQEERAVLLKGKAVDAVIRACTEKKKEIEGKLKEKTENKNLLVTRNETCKARIMQTEEECHRLSERGELLKCTIDQWLGKQSETITWDQLVEMFSRSTDWLRNEKQDLNRLKEEKTTLIATLAERQNALLRHHEAPIKPNETGETREDLDALLKELHRKMEEKITQNTSVDLILANHFRGIEKIKSFEKELLEKKNISENWKKLNDLLGSASGAKFKEIAQGYTLDILLLYANRHLQTLSGRYELLRIPDTLALQVADLDMLGETRAVHSLSGGESFLISLALALGLSSISSNRMSVESLFIDEGFGSLDVDTLRIALDALERLQTQGRKIGIISHVAEMTERITTQIQVVKCSNGKSEVLIVS